MDLLFTGDIVNTSGKKFVLSPELKAFFSSADHVIGNLEAPLAPESSYLTKIGPALRQGPEVLSMLEDMGFTHFSIANNHIMDHGTAGLQYTISALQGKYGVFGAGMSKEDIYRPIYLSSSGLTVGLCAAAENGFGGSAGNCPGFALYDAPALRETLRQMKRNADFSILVLHAGLEECPFPLPEWKNICREFCRSGVDVIIGHHPHVPQGTEYIEDSLIVYSLGNFVFDFMESAPSYVIKLHLEKGIQPEFSVFPFECADGALQKTAAFSMTDLQKILDVPEDEIDRIALDMWHQVYEKYWQETGVIFPGRSISYSWKRILRSMAKRLLGKKDDAALLWMFHNMCIDTHSFMQKRALKQLFYQNNGHQE